MKLQNFRHGRDYPYKQIIGDVNALSAFEDNFFDIIICHNVLKYIDDKTKVIKALTRVLKRYLLLKKI